MKPLVKVQMRRKIVPSDVDETYLIDGLGPLDIKNTEITVLDDGSTVISWLEKVPGWKRELYEWFRACVLGGAIIIFLLYFWTFGAAVFQTMGVI